MNELRDNVNVVETQDGASQLSRRYLLIDSCVVAAYYVPSSARYPKLSSRAEVLIDHCRNNKDEFRLLIPNFCIAEVFSVFAKHRFGKWNKQVKTPISDVNYWRSRVAFIDDIHNGRTFQQHELSRYHVLSTDLIYPVDHYYEFNRSHPGKGKKKRKVPMGAFDHLLIAMGIELVKLRGKNNVLLVTADGRLGNILKRASQIRPTSAARLGLLKIARDLGLEWSGDIYPKVLNLAKASDTELVKCFGQWPLTFSAPTTKPIPRLSQKHKDMLIRLYKRLTKESADSLSYSREFEILYDAFIAGSALDIDRHAVWTAMVNLRKRGMLPARVRKGK